MRAFWGKVRSTVLKNFSQNGQDVTYRFQILTKSFSFFSFFLTQQDAPDGDEEGPWVPRKPQTQTE